MSIDQANQAWKDAIEDRARVAEERFAQGLPPTPDDVIAVALAHPETYEVQVKAK